MPLLEVTQLHKHYTLNSKRGIMRRLLTRLGKPTQSGARQNGLYALDGVDLNIERNQSVGLVGESGCGKSTLVKTLSRLMDLDAGTIVLDGKPIGDISAAKFTAAGYRADIQVVFQDSHDSLNPRYSAYQCIADPLVNLLNIKDRASLDEKVVALAGMVNFPAELLTRLPHQLSGGQKARVNIARAIAVSPKLLILDEPTSALDVSIQAVILQLLVKLRRELQISYLFVSHDLNVVRMICDRIFVMYMGKIVEYGDANTLFYSPRHPYTQALIAAIPAKNKKESVNISGEVGSPINPDPNQCRFYRRCDKREQLCKLQSPPLAEIDAGHYAACHFA